MTKQPLCNKQCSGLLITTLDSSLRSSVPGGSLIHCTLIARILRSPWPVVGNKDSRYKSDVTFVLFCLFFLGGGGERADI